MYTAVGTLLSTSPFSFSPLLYLKLTHLVSMNVCGGIIAVLKPQLDPW